jgi:hypothetical protein
MHGIGAVLNHGRELRKDQRPLNSDKKANFNES